MGGSSSQLHTEQPMSLIHAFPIEDMYSPEFSDSFQNPVLFKKPLVMTLPLKSRAHHQSQSRSRLEDAKRGRFKTRMHPSTLHGQMRKKLCCVKVGFMYPKAANWVSQGRMLDMYEYCKKHKKTAKTGQTRTRERIECKRAGSI
ncbi:hypothetical protein Tco_0477577 [Tanacetum coccineum]